MLLQYIFEGLRQIVKPKFHGEKFELNLQKSCTGGTTAFSFFLVNISPTALMVLQQINGVMEKNFGICFPFNHVQHHKLQRVSITKSANQERQKLDKCDNSCVFYLFVFQRKRARHLILLGWFCIEDVPKGCMTISIHINNTYLNFCQHYLLACTMLEYLHLYICDQTCYQIMWLGCHCTPGIPNLRRVKTFPQSPALDKYSGGLPQSRLPPCPKQPLVIHLCAHSCTLMLAREIMINATNLASSIDVSV